MVISLLRHPEVLARIFAREPRRATARLVPPPPFEAPRPKKAGVAPQGDGTGIELTGKRASAYAGESLPRRSRLPLDPHRALAAQIDADVGGPRSPGAAVVVQGIWHAQQQAALRVIGGLELVELDIAEAARARCAARRLLAHRETLAAELRGGNDDEKVRAAADRLAVGVHVGDPDLALRICPGLPDQIADPVEIVARPHFGGVGRRAEREEDRPCISHVTPFRSARACEACDVLR